MRSNLFSWQSDKINRALLLELFFRHRTKHRRSVMVALGRAFFMNLSFYSTSRSHVDEQRKPPLQSGPPRKTATRLPSCCLMMQSRASPGVESAESCETTLLACGNSRFLNDRSPSQLALKVRTSFSDHDSAVTCA